MKAESLTSLWHIVKKDEHVGQFQSLVQNKQTSKQANKQTPVSKGATPEATFKFYQNRYQDQYCMFSDGSNLY